MSPSGRDEYRLRPMYFWLGAAGMVLYGAIDAFFFQLAYYNADGSFPHPELFAAFWSCFWGLGVLLSLFILLAAWRHCLRTSDKVLVDQGIFFQRRIRFKDVAVIEWRILSKSISIRGGQAHIRIYLTSIPAAQQKRLIDFLRTTFPLEIQRNWKQFDQCQNEPHLVRRIPSRGVAVVCNFILLGFCAVCGYSWVYEAGYVFAWTALGSLIAALWYVYRIVYFQRDSYMCFWKLDS